MTLSSSPLSFRVFRGDSPTLLPNEFESWSVDKIARIIQPTDMNKNRVQPINIYFKEPQETQTTMICRFDDIFTMIFSLEDK